VDGIEVAISKDGQASPALHGNLWPSWERCDGGPRKKFWRSASHIRHPFPRFSGGQVKIALAYSNISPEEKEAIAGGNLSKLIRGVQR